MTEIIDKKYNLIFSFFRLIYRLFKKFLKPSKKKIIIVKKFNCSFFVYLNEDLGFRLKYLPGTHEDKEIYFIEKFFSYILKNKKKVFFVDIGANFGLYSIYLGKKYSNSLIHAFEPNKEASFLLKKNKIYNKLDNIKIHETALSYKTGFTSFQNSNNESTYNYIQQNINNKINKIKVKTLDNFLKENKTSIDIVKIDVEGAEYQVLLGALKMLNNKKNKPKLIMVELVDEMLKRFKTSKKKVLNFMNKLKYDCYIIDKKKIIPYTSQLYEQNYFFIDNKIDINKINLKNIE